MRKPAIIFDRDGTLASCPLRPDDRSGEAWREFNAAMVFDPIVPRVAAILRSIRPGVARIMVSGRSRGDHPGDLSRWFQMKDWIAKHDLPIDHLYMRAGGDHRRDSIVKEEILDTYILPTFDVRYVIDDRPQVVEMWQRRGFPVLQVTDPDLNFNIGAT